MRKSFAITVDGRECAFGEEETLLKIAKREKIFIPTLCHDDRLKEYGACRLCVVRINGAQKLFPACIYRPANGDKIITEDEEMFSVRKTILQLVAPFGPSECDKCKNFGLCEFHSLTTKYGVTDFNEKSSMQFCEDKNPFIKRDYSKCVLCYRCVRICDEVQASNALSAAWRGYKTKIIAGFDGGLLQSSCEMCGQCIHTCPTGALSDKKFYDSIKNSDGGALETIKTVCPYCGTGCTIKFLVKNGRIMGVLPDMENPKTEGALCVKGQFGWDFVYSPERLTHPLIKKKGKFVRASWDEALDFVAKRFIDIKSVYGGEFFAGFASGRATNEANYLFQKFFRALIGTNNIDNCART